MLSSPRLCRHCDDKLEPNPVLQFSANATLLIIGQAPGLAAHQSGIAFNDPSGRRLRQWLGITNGCFYDPQQVAIVPMGFCYPGKGKSGDNPPDPRCAPRWHHQLLEQMSQLKLTILLGQHAQRHYLQGFSTTTAAVQQWQQHLAVGVMPLPHPSPRNNIWLKRNPWFEQQLLPPLQQAVAAALG
ncbi:uracil-DNA glycosylase family protein [Ferrimonas lipolytica]|uniref:Uracil-DNA glycosylase family protein n=1 Tax=Ferrimonas lipolytica TaxID=2724191 RepID=A0A6H1UHI8_9GAMM|nr:uracil-DNA glycosylase family protein [Ferrimonas lipolytica]QIZ78567.1 uracil-DNA glycosylase family protein [Ferrimonas lipolytica]